MKPMRVLCGMAAIATIAGCAIRPEFKQGQVASVIDYLYPGGTVPTPAPTDTVAELKVPLRIGLAVVPGNGDPSFRISEAERMALLARVREAFQRYPFVGSIETIPSSYLQAGGGYDNLERIAAVLHIDCIALLSYDQMQFAETTGWSAFYWTGIGAYVVPADRYDIRTSVDSAVLHVPSRKVLMRAGGTSRVQGHATYVGFSGEARDARGEGYKQAVDKLIPTLHAELAGFRERAPKDHTIRLVLPEGYDPKAVKAVRATANP